MPYVISGHGTYHWDFDVTVPVPNNINLIFFKDSGGTMRMDRSWSLYEALQEGKQYKDDQKLASEVRSIILPGQLVPDFQVTGDDSFPSGALLVSNTNGEKSSKEVVSLRSDEAKRGFDLLQAISKDGGGDVYWLACTKVMSNIKAAVVNGYIDNPRKGKGLGK
ncbi:MAG TPA: hypothetical protein VF584_17375 [Longimicrobium sp.]|jgi:hypothetical protein